MIISVNEFTFFVMMLARSRMKFVRFPEIPFTTKTAIDAHEDAF
jgi:transposase